MPLYIPPLLTSAQAAHAGWDSKPRGIHTPCTAHWIQLSLAFAFAEEWAGFVPKVECTITWGSQAFVSKSLHVAQDQEWETKGCFNPPSWTPDPEADSVLSRCLVEIRTAAGLRQTLLIPSSIHKLFQQPGISQMQRCPGQVLTSRSREEIGIGATMVTYYLYSVPQCRGNP